VNSFSHFSNKPKSILLYKFEKTTQLYFTWITSSLAISVSFLDDLLPQLFHQ
jgi:hypothetical protein